MMMIPRRSANQILDDIFSDPFFRESETKVMKTDIKENENNFALSVDLPGYEKEDIKIEVEEGYLTIHASKNSNVDEEEEGKFVRRERYFGECSRSFYVGESVETEDIKANFKNGVLKLEIPKKEEVKEIPEKKYVQID